VDLSAIIFVVLALAWAVYLIPKALKHHDELASDRLVEGHSDKVRILSRRSSATGVTEVVEVETEHVDTFDRRTDLERELAPKPRPVVERRPVARQPVTRATARKAAQRRRRVLGVLVLALAVVWTLDWFAMVPIWAPAVPGALVVGWLVLARLSARKLNVARRPVTRPVAEEVVETRVETTVHVPRESQDLVDLLTEDTIGVPRQEVEAALADDGSLWDPLPVTLPTYVNKARARRTVRTIELTGINSSGHDQADTALAREAEESTEAAQDTDNSERKAAGA
jgi:hypothetical protein